MGALGVEPLTMGSWVNPYFTGPSTSWGKWMRFREINKINQSVITHAQSPSIRSILLMKVCRIDGQIKKEHQSARWPKRIQTLRCHITCTHQSEHENHIFWIQTKLKRAKQLKHGRLQPWKLIIWNSTTRDFWRNQP